MNFNTSTLRASTKHDNVILPKARIIRCRADEKRKTDNYVASLTKESGNCCCFT